MSGSTPFSKLLSAAVVAACLASAQPALAARGVALPPPDPSGQGNVAEYRIGPQDKLDISVFQVPDLTRSVEVDASGKVLLPLIGELQASGRTPDELSKAIAGALKNGYVNDPRVTVAVTQSPSQSVTIDGAVREPGVYPIAGDTTLLQAVALAKGPDSRLANLRRVAIYRTVGGTRQMAIFDLAAIRDGKAEDPPVFGRDVIVVDQSGAKSLLQTLGSSVPLLRLMGF
ncbi:MAG: polysaccharide biosynthesis/export family protein [Parcubacteria group bacterium]